MDIAKHKEDVIKVTSLLKQEYYEVSIILESEPPNDAYYIDKKAQLRDTIENLEYLFEI